MEIQGLTPRIQTTLRRTSACEEQCINVMHTASRIKEYGSQYGHGYDIEV